MFICSWEELSREGKTKDAKEGTDKSSIILETKREWDLVHK